MVNKVEEEFDDGGFRELDGYFEGTKLAFVDYLRPHEIVKKGFKLAFTSGAKLSKYKGDLSVKKTPSVENKSKGSVNGSKEAENPNKGTDKKNLEVQFTKEQLATKPSYSPAPDKWTKKGGTAKIDEDGTWVYTNKKGQTVRYPDRYPDFTEYAHPTVKPVEIEIASPTNRPLDYKNANKKAGLNKDSDPPVASLNEAPEGYTWHHHQDGKTMILVDKKVHREFTHAGGVSIVNGN